MSGTTAAFSSSETAALERQTDSEECNHTLEQVWSEPQRKVCIGWIRQNSYKRICLQFPDNYLPHSDSVSDSMKEALSEVLDMKIFILADTSYGSCCVDEIAAAHVDADSIIHFGNACRSKVSRLPVLYVYPILQIDVQNLCQQLEQSLQKSCADKEVCIYLDIGYHHLLDEAITEPYEESVGTKIKQILSSSKGVHIEVYPSDENGKSDHQPSTDRLSLFVGGDNNRFFNLSLNTTASQWFIYDTIANTLEEKNPLTAKYIRRRYYYIEKCKDAQTLGLIVATLTAEGYLDVIARLQMMAKCRGIKTQIISVGRINPAKLANFLEIDCFVLIGCPFNNSYNERDFYKPIVSVFEAEIALNPAWHLKYPDAYVTDFKELLPNGRSFLTFNAADIAEQDVSLVSGRLRTNIAHEKDTDKDASALVEQQQALTRPGMEVMTSNVGLTFEDRTWKGLEPALGCTEPAKLQKGLSGIPIKYSHN